MRRILLAALLCSLAFPALAEDKPTIEQLKADVARGDLDAEASLAARYLNGDGVTSDIKEGLRLLEHAASRGNAEAESGLAQLYDHGRPGVPQDKELALRYFKSAAEHGSPFAQVKIGQFYLSGTRGLEKDRVKAIKYFQAVTGYYV